MLDPASDDYDYPGHALCIGERVVRLAGNRPVGHYPIVPRISGVGIRSLTVCMQSNCMPTITPSWGRVTSFRVGRALDPPTPLPFYRQRKPPTLHYNPNY